MAGSHQCSGCGSYQQVVLEAPVLVVCRQCGNFIIDNTRANPVLRPAPMPQDWTFIQIGTTGFIDDKQFAVIGRVRLQLLNEYKNIWTIVTESATTLLLTESFGSFFGFSTGFHRIPIWSGKIEGGTRCSHSRAE